MKYQYRYKILVANSFCKAITLQKVLLFEKIHPIFETLRNRGFGSKEEKERSHPHKGDSSETQGRLESLHHTTYNIVCDSKTGAQIVA